MRITIDTEQCTGHGRCYAVSPDVFDADDEGRGVVTVEMIGPDLEQAARRAEANCPERAIHLLD